MAGVKTHLRSAKAAEAKMFNDQTKMQQQVASAEQTRGNLQTGLGSEEQMSGQYDPGIAAYSNRVKLDQLANKKLQGLGRAMKTSKALDIETQANSLMDQATAAYRNGDKAGADALKAQAETLLGTAKKGTRNLYQTIQDPTLAAEAQLGSEQGKVVGGMIQQARGFQEGEGNAIYDKIYETLTKDALAANEENRQLAERALVNNREGVDRAIRDSGAARGAGRNIYAENAAVQNEADKTARGMADIHNVAGARAAEIHGATKQYMNNVGLMLEQNAPQLAQAWVSNAAGVRDEYTQMQGAIYNNLTELHNQIANREWSQYEAAKASDNGDWVDGLLSAVGSLSITSQLGQIFGGGGGGGNGGGGGGGGGGGLGGLASLAGSAFGSGGTAAAASTALPALTNSVTGAAVGAGTATVTGTVGAAAGGVGSAIGSAIGTIASFFSDENMKTDKKPLKGGRAMDKFERMPVETWRYKGDGERHIGPMAQDFSKEFGVGDGKTIAFQDIIGAQSKAIAELAKEVRSLKERK